MKIRRLSQSGLTLIELSITTVVAGVIGLAAYSLLNINMVLSAKNTAINTTHQQARMAMLNMQRDLHSSVSVPLLAKDDGEPYLTPPTSGKAAGVAFQKWASGPYAIKADALTGQKVVRIALLANQAIPTYYGAKTQKLIVPTHQIEDYITAISGTKSDLSITLTNNVPVAIKGTASTGGHVVCFITDSCSYAVKDNALNYKWRGTSSAKIAGAGITNPTPFYLPTTADGAGFILSIADMKYGNRNYKLTNILLNGQAPIKAQLTTYQ